MIKIGLIGLAAVLIAIGFKSTKPEYGTYIALTACLVIGFLGISRLEIILDTIQKFRSYLSINQEYFVILIKMIGITYISEFSSSLCKDAGYSAIAGQIELAGKLTILAVSMPVLLTLLETVGKFLK